MDSADKGGRRPQRGRRRGRSDKDRLMLSAWQSELFNRWLALRIQRGGFQELELGDLAKKVETGGLFLVEDMDVDRPRFLRREIDYTGPMFGTRMRRPTGRPDALEREVLEQELRGADEEVLARAGLDGTRRAGRIAPRAMSISSSGADLVVSFELPKGSYATTLLEELMKLEAASEGSPGTAHTQG
jgi:tRNA pseudouridine13 synthase